ncbi:DUF4350 domain-containing protein [Haloplanus litoreus]|uniref:DUF4350 domain-containing protein n=1 Tax=Haloplanus litoreus TaxID=767515 RepID=A0ABD5ZVY3_9EURY
MVLPSHFPGRLAVALAVVLVVAGLWGASTSDPAFGAYNPGWDGTSNLHEEARAAAASSVVATRTAAYDGVVPGRTVALVLSPDEAYAEADAARLRRFVRAGGTLVVAEDFGPHSNSLLRRLGAETRVDGRLVRDERHYYRSPSVPVATGVAPSRLTEDVDSLTLNHGTVLDPHGSRVVVETSPFAYLDDDGDASLDSGESMRRYPVVTAERLGEGQVVVVADPSLFINAMIERDGNRRFTRGLFAGRETVLFDHSHTSGVPPLIGAALALQRSPALQGLLGSLLLGIVLLLSARLPPIRSRRRGTPGTVLSPDRGLFRRRSARRRPARVLGRLVRRVTGVMMDEKQKRSGTTNDERGGDGG